MRLGLPARKDITTVSSSFLLCLGPIDNPSRGDSTRAIEPEHAPSVEPRVLEQSRTNSGATLSHRLYPPGSEWLFIKLYCPHSREDDLIGDSLLSFAGNVIASGLADSWFYIRYADSEGHVRLRFHGAPERLSSLLFSQVCQWATGLMATGAVSRFAFDTYDREIERFGGPQGSNT